jgi:hypothetical protein
MIRSVFRSADGTFHTNLTQDEFNQTLEDPDGVLWVDLVRERQNVCEPILARFFISTPWQWMMPSRRPTCPGWTIGGIPLYCAHAVV